MLDKPFLDRLSIHDLLEFRLYLAPWHGYVYLP